MADGGTCTFNCDAFHVECLHVDAVVTSLYLKSIICLRKRSSKAKAAVDDGTNKQKQGVIGFYKEKETQTSAL